MGSVPEGRTRGGKLAHKVPVGAGKEKIGGGP